MDIRKLNDLVFLYAGKRSHFNLAYTASEMTHDVARDTILLIEVYRNALIRKRDVVAAFDKAKSKDTHIDIMLCSYLQTVILNYFPDLDDLSHTPKDDLRPNAERIIEYCLTNNGFPVEQATEYAITFVSTVPKESYKGDKSWLKMIWLNLKKFLKKHKTGLKGNMLNVD